MKLSQFLNEWIPGVAPGDEKSNKFMKNKDGSITNSTVTGRPSNEFEERVIKKEYPAFYKKRVTKRKKRTDKDGLPIEPYVFLPRSA